jgi:AcrR family transcriptional regulator
MPKTKQQFEEMKRASVENINITALKLFAQRGLAATNISNVAAAAGISTGLMYHYYASKEDLYCALVREAVEGANDSVQRAVLLTDSPSQQIQALSNIFIQELTSKTGMSPYYYSLMSQVMLNPELLSVEKQFHEEAYKPFKTIESIIKRGQASGEIKTGNPAALTIMYLSAFNGLCSYKLMLGDKFVIPQEDWLNGILLVKNN